MGKKYIIEIPEDKITDFVGSTHFLMPYSMAGHKGHHDTELPIKPYTDPDLEQVRKEAYDKAYADVIRNCYESCSYVKQVKKEAYQKGYETGYEDGKELCPLPKVCHNNAYQKGLSDAWEAARKLWEIDISTLHKIFYKETRMDCYMYYTATEAVAKIKEYEDKQEEIKVGNEVKAFEKKPFIVTGFGYGDDEEDVYCYGFVTENGISTSAKKNSCVRTGRHFPEIAAIFEKMRNEPNAQIDT